MIKKCLVIAEVGLLHDGKLDLAKKLIDLAKHCGADIVKFQTHIADAETLRNAPMPPYFKEEPRYEYFKRTEFNLGQWRKLVSYCRIKRIGFLSSPFSIEAVKLLESAGAKQYKIPSGEVTNLPLLREAARMGKPIFMSSGMSLWKELDEAVKTIRRYNNQLILLQCTSNYPCRYEEVGLNIMLQMRGRYKLPVGLSDHTLTNYASFAAVALGAFVIEKHITLSRKTYGSDAKHSLMPDEFIDLVKGIRAIEIMASSKIDKDKMSKMLKQMKEVFEKSIVTLKDIPKGALISADKIGLKKPGTGMPARRIKDVIGRYAARHIPSDRILKREDLLDA